MSKSYKNIIYEKKNGIAFLTLNRPHALNALDFAIYADIFDVLDEVEGDDEVKVLVIKGTGRAFSAGADFKCMQEMKTLKEKMDFVSYHNLGNNRLEAMKKPVIAQIHGFACGGGLELALACDIRICSDDTKLGLPEVNFGDIPGGGGVQRLPRTVGKAIAKEIIMTGKHIVGKEAERIGLVNHSVPLEKLENTVMELAKLIGSKIPATVQGIKRAINRGMEMPLISAIDTSMEMTYSRVEEERKAYRHKYAEEEASAEAYKSRFEK